MYNCISPSTHVWKRHHKVMKISLLSCFNNLFHANVPGIISVLYVLGYAAVKQNRLLGHYSDLGSQEGHVD